MEYRNLPSTRGNQYTGAKCDVFMLGIEYYYHQETGSILLEIYCASNEDDVKILWRSCKPKFIICLGLHIKGTL